ncbi:MAG: PorT family protein [Bacteroidetes bacterium]|nr:PorT family protein [Bacteroidota bacterium]MBU1719058.1 PorT family protein [Bacteroidota bacterium]
MTINCHIRHFLTILTFVIFSGSIHSQTSSDDNLKPKMTKQEHFIVDIYSDIWTIKPDSILKPEATNPGAAVFGLWDNPIGKSNFSLAFGIGISAHNIYTDKFPGDRFRIDTAGYIFSEEFTTFYNIPGTLLNGDKLEYKKNKISVAYVDVPVEFRFRTRSLEKAKFRAAIGFRAGVMVGSKNKYKGDDYVNNTDHQIKMKTHDIPFILPYRYGITARVGYSLLNLSVYYGLTKLFEKDKGPEISNLSVGISIIPF